MHKLIYGQKGQVSFHDLSEYYYAMGFLADSRRAELRWEHNEDQGAWGSEGRIHCLVPESMFPPFFSFTAGRGNVYARINCNDYVGTLITDHNFSYNGKKNNIDEIIKTVPEQYLQLFYDGYNNKKFKVYKNVGDVKKQETAVDSTVSDKRLSGEEIHQVSINVGDDVRHKNGKIGQVVSLNDRYISVMFNDKTLTFQFPKAFKDGFLKEI